MKERDVTAGEISDAIISLQYSAILRLLRLWSETDSPKEMVQGFLRAFPGNDFGIDRIGVFEIGEKGPVFVIGTGIKAEKADLEAALKLKNGSVRHRPTEGIGYDLIIRVGRHLFCFDDTSTGREFSAAIIKLLVKVARVMDHILRIKFEAEKHRHLAEHDALTGLPNRRGAESRFEAIAARGTAISVAFIDFDHFKGVNDNYGHAVGDKAIRMMARRIADCAIRAGGFAARFGGDEFLACIPGEAGKLLEKLRSVIESDRTVKSDHHDLVFTVSIGYALWNTRREKSPGEAMKRADRAVYRAKEAGRNRVARY